MTKKGPSDIGMRLRQLRERSGLSARKLDELAGTAVGLASMIESGERRGRQMDTMRKYAAALGSTFEYLAWGIGKPPSVADVATAVRLAESRRQRTKVA